MKSPFLLTPILAITLSLIPWQSKGLTQAPCFLQGPDGRQIDLGGLCGGGQNSVQPSTNRPADSYQIPIKRRLNGIPTVEVVINGQHRFEMLFDTGASVVVLDQGMANKIGLNDSKPVGFAQTAGGWCRCRRGVYKP